MFLAKSVICFLIWLHHGQLNCALVNVVKSDDEYDFLKQSDKSGTVLMFISLLSTFFLQQRHVQKSSWLTVLCLRCCLLRHSFAIWCVVSGSLPRSMFFAHLLLQSMNSLLHYFMYCLLALSPSLSMCFSSGSNCFIQSLMMEWRILSLAFICFGSNFFGISAVCICVDLWWADNQ